MRIDIDERELAKDGSTAKSVRTTAYVHLSDEDEERLVRILVRAGHECLLTFAKIAADLDLAEREGKRRG